MTTILFSDNRPEDRKMKWAGSYPPAYSGIFLSPSVNKIQLFTSEQMQPPALPLCNDPLGADILWEATVKAKCLFVSDSSQTPCPLGPALGYSHPPADTLEKQVQL